MKKIVYGITLAILVSVIALNASIMETESKTYRHSIDTFPFAPLIDIWGIHYLYQFSEKDEFITGLSYMSLKKESGQTHSPALIIGYRRYLWKNLHIEYEIWPCWDDYWEKNEQKYYSGFDVWNEFRLGYRFDVEIGNTPFYANIQWPFGFALYTGNKPDSFMKEIEGHKYFYHIPMLFIGFRF